MDEEDDLFDWVSNVYQSDNLPEQGSQVDLTKYEVKLGPIYKEPTGEEYIDGVEVKKINE